MKIFWLVVFVSGSVWATENVDLKNCAPENKSEIFLYQSDFSNWKLNLEQMATSYKRIYNLDKRLQSRAYYDKNEKVFKLPFEEMHGGDVELPLSFVKNIALHIQSALEKKVIDFVFFPDMGHSHFFLPQKKYDEEYAKIDKIRFVYEKFLKDPDLKVLYHTAEQLHMFDDNKDFLPDERTQFRLQYRNLVGLNNGSKELFYLQNPESRANSTGHMENHKDWSSGFNISANKKGCFYYVFNNEKVYFDLSLQDLQLDPSIKYED